MLLLLVLLLQQMITAAAALGSMTLPGCPASCGNVSIPYPFGIGRGCFRDGFEITCDRARISLAGFDIQVLSLSVQEASAQVLLPIGWQCYNQSGVEGYYSAEQNFTREGVYRLSISSNRFVVIGCNSLAWIQMNANNDNKSAPYAYDYYAGCVTYCNDAKSVVDGSCNGIGCCQVAIPADVTDYSYYFGGYSHSTFLGFSPCSYAFVVDKDWFRLNTSSLTMNRNTSVPVWLDWAVRDMTCPEAKRDPTFYSCRSSNSECYDSVNGPGHFCNCSQGYQGNPYLTDGCTDIDECSLPDEYPCHGVCNNKPGSYDCRCPRGQQGEPRIKPCIPKLPLPAKLAIIGLCISIVCTVSVFFIIGFYRRRRQLRENDIFFKKNGGLMLYEKMVSEKVDTIKIFTKEDMERITENFTTLLGHGGSGNVYKGRLDDKREVAIKKSIVINNEPVPKEEFVNEIIILSQMNHKNVVRLLGCCLELDVPMIVYEFVSNGTLHDFLHRDHSPIDLDTRLRLAVESAEALSYMHSSTARPVLHGDVKSKNILLDGNKMAKVSDFGASKLFPIDVTRLIITCTVVGTFGYLDPEFLRNQRITEKSDVYSFGVVLLELITRKEAVYEDGDGEFRSLTQSFTLAMKSNQLKDMVDDDVATEEDMKFLEVVANLAVECVRPKGEKRPEMKEVADRLKECRRSWLQQQSQKVARVNSIYSTTRGEFATCIPSSEEAVLLARRS